MSKLSNKQTLLHLGLIIFSVIIFTTSIINQSADQANLRLGLASPRPTLSQKDRIDIIVPPHGNFSLPAFGILPSHPLYLTKMAKDRVVLLLTFDREKQARLLLTYSNVRMSAANQLAQYGEIDLAVTTAIKGQTYFWRAINASNNIPENLQPEWYDLLKQTALKHEEVLERIRFVAKDARRDQAQRLWEQLGEYRQHISNLSGIPFNYPRPEDSLTTSTDQPYL